MKCIFITLLSVLIFSLPAYAGEAVVEFTLTAEQQQVDRVRDALSAA